MCLCQSPFPIEINRGNSSETQRPHLSPPPSQNISPRPTAVPKRRAGCVAPPRGRHLTTPHQFAVPLTTPHQFAVPLTTLHQFAALVSRSSKACSMTRSLPRPVRESESTGTPASAYIYIYMVACLATTWCMLVYYMVHDGQLPGVHDGLLPCA